MDWSKNGVLEGAFCRRRLNYVFPPLSSPLLTLFSPLPLSLRDSQLNGVDWPIKEKGRDGSKQWSALGWLVGESSGFRPNNATRGHGT